MENETKEIIQPSFVRNHGDTLAIVGVNVAMIALMITLWIAQTNRTDVMNARLDTIQSLMYQEMKNFHGRLTILETK